MAKPIYQRGGIELYHGDCREVIPQLPDLAARIDGVVSDPPYGIDYVKGDGGRGKHTRRNREPIVGDDGDFDPGHLLKFPNVLIWGADHYAQRLPRGRFLAWDKLAGLEPWDSFSDIEFAWHSKRGKASIISYRWKGICGIKTGEDNGARPHPMTKPVGVMAWSIKQAGIKPGGTILDPYMGAGPTAVAAVRYGFSCIGIEIDLRWIDKAIQRVDAEFEKMALFGPPLRIEAVEPADLFQGETI